jgi:hypothetical protein
VVPSVHGGTRIRPLARNGRRPAHFPRRSLHRDRRSSPTVSDGDERCHSDHTIQGRFHSFFCRNTSVCGIARAMVFRLEISTPSATVSPPVGHEVPFASQHDCRHGVQVLISGAHAPQGYRLRRGGQPGGRDSSVPCATNSALIARSLRTPGPGGTSAASAVERTCAPGPHPDRERGLTSPEHRKHPCWTWEAGRRPPLTRRSSVQLRAALRACQCPAVL